MVREWQVNCENMKCLQSAKAQTEALHLKHVISGVDSPQISSGYKNFHAQHYLLEICCYNKEEKPKNLNRIKSCDLATSLIT